MAFIRGGTLGPGVWAVAIPGCTSIAIQSAELASRERDSMGRVSCAWGEGRADCVERMTVLRRRWWSVESRRSTIAGLRPACSPILGCGAVFRGGELVSWDSAGPSIGNPLQ